MVSVVRAENTPVVNWRQAAALLDWGFALPAGPPAVGTLVDAAPPPPTASAGTAGPVGHLHRPGDAGVRLPGGVRCPADRDDRRRRGAAVAVALLAVALHPPTPTPLRTRRPPAPE